MHFNLVLYIHIFVVIVKSKIGRENVKGEERRKFKRLMGGYEGLFLIDKKNTLLCDI